MSDRLSVTYRISGNDPRRVAEAIRVEQTIEFPFDLAPDWIQNEIVGQIDFFGESVTGPAEVAISYNPEIFAGQISAFLNVLWGNVSLFPGVRIVGLEIPDSFLKNFSGPKFGVSGLRKLFGAESRPLLTTAIKPMGLSTSELVKMSTTLAEAGFDIIKDDHSLANQPWARWRERVVAISEAVAKVNSKNGSKVAYAPSLNLPADEIREAALFAREHGAGALLLLPGLQGFDLIRVISDEIGLPIMGHPTMLGSLVTSPDSGISHGIVFGTLMRLAGADISIFPNHGGRFSFSPSECREIAAACKNPLGDLSPIWPAPAGGMSAERVPEILTFYGKDAALLVGGALHRGDLAVNAKILRDAAN